MLRSYYEMEIKYSILNFLIHTLNTWHFFTKCILSWSSTYRLSETYTVDCWRKRIFNDDTGTFFLRWWIQTAPDLLEKSQSYLLHLPQKRCFSFIFRTSADIEAIRTNSRLRRAVNTGTNTSTTWTDTVFKFQICNSYLIIKSGLLKLTAGCQNWSHIIIVKLLRFQRPY